ncbi:serine/threonine-protein kinase PAK 3-like [Hirundo rustica]|uniref:serine/threonine-protein kinase PAK 3-like n=1 Tax=Hirundo rustica TaxID=43150 RepID=UPI001A94F98F|nr:serine/threonine-protein kinase PAK 3-like [Hirundo rustica]
MANRHKALQVEPKKSAEPAAVSVLASSASEEEAKEEEIDMEDYMIPAVVTAELEQSMRVAVRKINLRGLRKKELNFNELMVMRMSRNPNLVNCLDSYLVDKQFWLVMEYMDGGTLSDVISKTYLSDDEMAAISRECLQGLDFLHSDHVIHRDVKSRNILLRTDGSVNIPST